MNRPRKTKNVHPRKEEQLKGQLTNKKKKLGN